MEITSIKQYMDKLLDQDFIAVLFNQRLNKFYPDFKQVDSLIFHPYKRHVGKTSMIMVVEYVLSYLTIDEKIKTISLFSSAHSDGSRTRSFYGQSYLYDHGFDQGNFLVGRPLFYLDEQFAFFYEAVLGRTFRKVMQEKPDQDFSVILDLAARWVKKMHDCPIDKENKFVSFDFSEMSPKPQRFLDDMTKVYPELGKRLDSTFHRLADLKKKNFNTFPVSIIHGDYHPENIIVKKSEPDKIKVIDFTDLSLGDPMVDLGSFIQQIDFMGFECLSRANINKYKTIFLEYYFNKKFEDIDINDLNRINLYQAWVVLRTTLLLFYAKSASHPLGELIEEIDRYLSLAESSQRKINLY